MPHNKPTKQFYDDHVGKARMTVRVGDGCLGRVTVGDWRWVAGAVSRPALSPGILYAGAACSPACMPCQLALPAGLTEAALVC